MSEIKKFKRLSLLVCSVLTALVLLAVCTKDKTPVPLEPCAPGKIYFQNNIMPIISSNCAKSGCHDAITAANGVNLSNYGGIIQIVRPGNPSRSKLMEVLNSAGSEEAMPPYPDTPLKNEQKNLISSWISEGALNNFCTQDTVSCSAANASYANDISKIINTNCLGCHSGNTLSGGVSLSGYAAVQSVATSGKLFNSVSQNGSAVPMPPSLKLPPCDIKKIKSWIDAGSHNN